MKIQRAYKLRLYPNGQQAEQLKRFGGTCRWLWNELLRLNQNHYAAEKKFHFYADMAARLPEMKKQTDWLGETPACSLQRVARNLDSALRAVKKGKGFPRFKKKSHNRDSFYLTNQSIRVEERHVRLPKIGLVRFRAGRAPEGRILSAAITQDGDRWHISVLCEVEIEDRVMELRYSESVGIDLGLKELAITSDGEVLENPRHLRKAQKRLRRLQHQMSKSKKGSQNRRKKQLRLYRAHRKVRQQRVDLLHKFTTGITNQYGVICLEDLNVKGMMRNRRLAAAIADAGWGELVRQLAYKAAWSGRHFVQIGRFQPSSQVCSSCGHRQAMPLDVRTYDCPSCHVSIDRDLNAAMNIRDWGYEELVGRGTPEPQDAHSASCNACGDTSAGITPLAA